MLHFRPNLQFPLVLSSLCILLSQVQAQSTPPECAIQCGDIAASQTGFILTDTSYICNSPAFQSAAGQCVASSCSPSDAQAATTYFTDLCSGAARRAYERRDHAIGLASSGSAPPKSGSLVSSTTESGSFSTSLSSTSTRAITFSSSASKSKTGSKASSSGSATSPTSSSLITSSPSSSSSSSGSSSQPASSSSSTSSSSSSGSSSQPTSSSSSTTSSNAAATATHAAALLAGGLGALFAVVV